MRHVIAVVVRALVLFALFFAVAALASLGHDAVGVDIGAGLAGLFAQVVGAFVWAGIDAYRLRRLGVVALRWVGVAALVAVAGPLQAQGWTLHPDTEVLRLDLGVLVPFTLAQMGVPALLGALLGHVLPRRRAATAVGEA